MVSEVFDVEKYNSRPNKDGDLLGLEEDDFTNLMDEFHRDGIVNNVHYDIQSGEQVTTDNDGVLRVEFINNKK